MLTDIQLSKLCDKMGVPLELICFKDEIPKKLKYNKSYIINLEDSLDENGDENEGTHWTCLQINKYSSGKIEPFYFDSYGAPPPEIIKKSVLDTCGQKLPFNTKDIQSLMNSACGYFCVALLHFINECPHRCNDLYNDVEIFLSMFDDLNKSADWKKNEYILKMFFQPKDPSLRKEIDIESIVTEDSGRGIDLTEVPINVNYV